MSKIPLKVGGFVTTADRGLGKLVKVQGNQGLVRFRHSAITTEEVWYPLSKLERGYLSLQMRAFWYDEQKGRLLAGRVRNYLLENYVTYEVHFPNGRKRDISEKDLEARSSRKNSDPSEALADGWCETQFYYDRRAAALSALVRARAFSAGLTGLLSSSISLLQHQVEIVRRILADPVQRYLLADEVGLGKTVEAGCIIRQVLLDSAEERVAVLTPSPLLHQWARELREKFGIDEFAGRVVIKSFAEMADLENDTFDMLVIDEAHHLVGKAATAESKALYARVARLSHRVRRLLVLSATPVLSDDGAMLRLLHLLDPVVHRLDGVDSFRQKLANRQEYGRLLMALNPDAGPASLRRMCAKLQATFGDDEVVAALVPRLLTPDSDGPSTAEVVRTLKRHIADTYRLYQRLLRTRRKDLEWELLPRDSRIRLVNDPDPRISRLWNSLEDWRYHSLAAVRAAENPSLEAQFAQRYLRLHEALGQGVDELAFELKQQTSAVKAGKLPTFPEETEVISDFQRVLGAFPQSTERLTLVAGVLRDFLQGRIKTGSATPKVVVFASSQQAARRLADVLPRTLGRDAVATVLSGDSESAVDKAVVAFRLSEKPMVLVCDRSGEEGLNLHFVDAVVHLDLPLAPARLEQRVGRLDRYGRRGGSTHHAVILPTLEQGSPWAAWHELLCEGFELFSSSISDVQLLLEEIEQELALSLYRGGAEGLLQQVDWVRSQLEQERSRLDEQYALDQLVLGEDESSAAFATLEEYDSPGVYEDLNRWLVETMQLRRSGVKGLPGAFRLHWEETTLMPKTLWYPAFAPALDCYLTYERELAVRNPAVRLIRPGASLVRALEQHLLWDDRGTSFATWRVDPNWNSHALGEWVGFKLIYVVEFDEESVLRELAGQLDAATVAAMAPAIRRRADALFAPWVESLTLDTRLEEAEPAVAAILARPYLAHDRGGNDFNLGSRRDALFGVIPADRFYDLCKRVRERSEALIWQSAHFRERVDTAAERANQELQLRIDHLKRRKAALERLDGVTDPAVEREVMVDRAILAAIATPRVRLDAVGCFVVSSQPPRGATS